MRNEGTEGDPVTLPNPIEGIVPEKLAVFSDFDGTISHPDTLNFLAETFSSVEFRHAIGRQIASGAISLRDGIQQEVGTIKGTLEEVLAFLHKHVRIDAAFPPFAQWCLAQGVSLTILSAGIKDVIESLLKPYHLDHVKISANPLHINNGHWSVRFLDDTPWGNDKGRAVREAKERGFRTVFLGDGLSDRGAAASADLVFARAGLARYCSEHKIPFIDFQDFSAVQREVSHHLLRHTQH